MRARQARSGRLLATALVAAVVFGACGAPVPTPSPTATPVPTPTQVPSASAPIARATGGTVAVADGPTLAIPPGGVSVDTTATIRASAVSVPGESDDWPAAAIGPAWDIDLGGHILTEPASLTFHFDPAALPAGVSPGGLLVAYFDPAANAWQPVPATIDPAGTATATISHLSTWGFFGFDLDRWLVTLKALASGQITELSSAAQGLLTACATEGGGFTIDNSAANKMVEGCLDGVPAKGTAAISVTNLRAFALSLSSPRGYIDQQLVAPGDSVPFSVPKTDPPPATVSATMTTDGLWWSVTDIVMRMLPGWTELKASPSYTTIVSFAAAGTRSVWDASKISDDILARKYAQAAEKTVTLLTGKTYLDALVAALTTAGTKYGLPWLTIVDASMLTQILRVVNLADLIVTTWSFFGDYFFNAQTSVSVNWTQLTKPKAPRLVGADIPCLDGCPLPIPVHVTWKAPSGQVSGYRLYYTPGDVDFCHNAVWTATGPRRLVAKLGPRVVSWDGTVADRDQFGKFSVVAFNGAGTSPAAFSNWVGLVDMFVCW